MGGLGTDALFTIEKASLTGGAGDNTINASAFTRGAVTLIGGAGNDTLIGGSKNDSITGNGGNDTIVGNGGDDTLFGGAGIDDLQGGAGDDTLDGGAATDVLDCGAGDGDIVILGASVRGLAESASRAGWTVHAADLFCDLDLLLATRTAVRVGADQPGGYPRGLLTG